MGRPQVSIELVSFELKQKMLENESSRTTSTVFNTDETPMLNLLQYFSPHFAVMKPNLGKQFHKSRWIAWDGMIDRVVGIGPKTSSNGK
jgi:hypothetical protein